MRHLSVNLLISRRSLPSHCRFPFSKLGHGLEQDITLIVSTVLSIGCRKGSGIRAEVDTAQLQFHRHHAVSFKAMRRLEYRKSFKPCENTVWLTIANNLTLWTSNCFLQNSYRRQINFSMLLLGAELIFAKLPPVAGLFSSLKNLVTPREFSCL